MEATLAAATTLHHHIAGTHLHGSTRRNAPPPLQGRRTQDVSNHVNLALNEEQDTDDTSSDLKNCLRRLYWLRQEEVNSARPPEPFCMIRMCWENPQPLASGTTKSGHRHGQARAKIIR
uniref:Uncharacterized protein n=1 Tax=Zea mays TaxID=4577 RepID=A0A804LES6_MAIZE